MTMTRTAGFDWTLPDAPPLRKPPLSLLDLAVPLLQVDNAIAAGQEAAEQARSAQAAVEAAGARALALPPKQRAEAQLAAEAARSRLVDLEALVNTRAKELEAAQHWENGFEFWPELPLGSLEIFVPGSGSTKSTTANAPAKAWYDPFEAVAHLDASLFGAPYLSMKERAQRALRALEAHQPWQVEHEFWTGDSIPTNWHLTASPATATSSAHRTIDAWANPTAAPGTTLGTAAGLKQSLAALDQAIANSDAGVGMIHATPFLVQLWASTYPFLRDSAGRIYTVNFNLIVPGYGYPGTGPDLSRSVADAVTNGTTTVTSATAAFTNSDVGQAVAGANIPAGAHIVSRTSATAVVISAAATGSGSGGALVIGGDGGDATGSTLQWAYATDTVYRLAGAARTLPWDFREAAPELNVNNSVDVRAERSHALITNQLLRAAVLVDTATP